MDHFPLWYLMSLELNVRNPRFGITREEIEFQRPLYHLVKLNNAMSSQNCDWLIIIIISLFSLDYNDKNWDKYLKYQDAHIRFHLLCLPLGWLFPEIHTQRPREDSEKLFYPGCGSRNCWGNFLWTLLCLQYPGAFLCSSFVGISVRDMASCIFFLKYWHIFQVFLIT